MSEIITQATTVFECILKRPRGTQIDMNGTTYDFQPDEQGRHVAAVSDPRHVAVLLSIPEGYRMLGIVAGAPVKTEAKAEPVAAPVQEAKPEPVPAPKDESPAPVATMPPGFPAPPTADEMMAMDTDAVRKIYAVEVGKAAGPRAKQETMVETIIQMREIKAAG